jgi:poly(A) polymerase
MRLSSEVLALLPEKLLRFLALISHRRQSPVYFSGGVVRDWLLGLIPGDLDLTVPDGALAFARDLATALGASYVPLSPADGVARVVWISSKSSLGLDGDALWLDVSQFREGTATIEDDLRRRDFTANAMAVGFDCELQSLANGGLIIDPLGGLADLRQGLIRLTHPQALVADPLRMLRAYRFRAIFDWLIEKDTESIIVSQVPLLAQVSGERIAYELDMILACEQCHQTIEEMGKVGLLFLIFPELGPGVGLLQPSSHHLDVFGHSLETLRQIERIIHQPEVFFTLQAGAELDSRLNYDMSAYLSAPRQRIRLKYAALLHDLGKTTTCAEQGGRITFYNHDEAGVTLLEGVAERLRWSHEDTRRISQLVKQHMWPFHLHNAKVRTGITPKAVLKLVKAAGDDLIGLFFLVMADSLAGQGPGKPEGMEESVAVLFAEVYQTYLERLKPILEKPLLTGHDLIQSLHLTPGPFFKEILDALLEERTVEPEMSKPRALAWVEDYVSRFGKV